MNQLLEPEEMGATTCLKAPILDNYSDTFKDTDNDLASVTNEFQFFDLIKNYVKDLKSIKRPRISNVELLDGVELVSHNIAGCIKLPKSTLRCHGSKTRQKHEGYSPRSSLCSTKRYSYHQIGR